MTKRKKAREFTDAFKLQVLRDYYSSQGSTGSEIARKWNVNRTSINQWAKQWPIDSNLLSLPSETIEAYRMEHKETKLSNEEILQQRISSLEHALELEKMRSRAFEKMIEIAEEEEGISILKKGGAKQ